MIWIPGFRRSRCGHPGDRPPPPTPPQGSSSGTACSIHAHRSRAVAIPRRHKDGQTPGFALRQLQRVGARLHQRVAMPPPPRQNRASDIF